MIRKITSGIPFYEFELFQQFRGVLSHAVLTRHADIASPEAIQKTLQTNAAPISIDSQLHGTRIHQVPLKQKRRLEGDILITADAQTPLVIRIADCASILLFDPTKKIIANIHAGWRGLAARGIHRTLQELRQRFQVHPENIFAAVSPMLGPCCSRFSQPEIELPKFLHSYILEENMVDLWSIVVGQLRECGVKEDHIENPRICTFCNPEDFYSYRREPGAGRFGTAIMLK